MKRLLPLFVLILTLAFAHAADLTFYVGTGGGGGGKGIYKCTLDSDTGKLGPITLAAAAPSPGFLAMTPDGKFIYASSDDKGGSAIAFKVEKDGSLTLLNEQAQGKGGGAAHVWFDPATHDVLTASYGGGYITVFQTKDDGSLTERTGFYQFTGSGPNKDRQEAPHGHSIYTLDYSPEIHKYTTGPTSLKTAVTYVYSCDLGTDKVWIFKLDAKGALVPNDPPFAMVPPGSGPRHLAFSPDGKRVYVANEMGHTVTCFNFDPKNGGLTQFQNISTFPPGTEANYTGTMTVAEIYFHPSGKWLYVTNRDVDEKGRDSIAVYSVGADGKLTWIQDVPSPVKFPRGFGLDPAGHWLVVAGQHDNKISPLKIDQQTGKLTPTDQFVEAGEPICIQFAQPSK
ncbi:MAG TPA: lactonase family protein [Chthoniobacteraceae bacterium]|nr:lactonase family protein [Chthoniobacteraceae bacterium]